MIFTQNMPCLQYFLLLDFNAVFVLFQLLADLENNKMFSEDLECQKLLMEAMKYHLLPERRPMLQSPRTKPRKSTVGSLYAVGGMDASKGGHIFVSPVTSLKISHFHKW